MGVTFTHVTYYNYGMSIIENEPSDTIKDIEQVTISQNYNE